MYIGEMESTGFSLALILSRRPSTLDCLVSNSTGN
jgi:hypothetical protein